MRNKTLSGFLILFLITSLYYFILIYNDVKENAFSQLTSRQLIHAEQAKKGIEDFFADIISSLSALSESDSIIDLTDEGKACLDQYLGVSSYSIKALTRVDDSGTIIYTVPPDKTTIGSDILYQAHVQRIFKNPEPVVSDVFMAVQGYPAIALHVPVFEGNQFHGTLAVLIDFTSLSERF